MKKHLRFPLSSHFINGDPGSGHIFLCCHLKAREVSHFSTVRQYRRQLFRNRFEIIYTPTKFTVLISSARHEWGGRERPELKRMTSTLLTWVRGRKKGRIPLEARGVLGQGSGSGPKGDRLEVGHKARGVSEVPPRNSARTWGVVDLGFGIGVTWY